MVTGNVARYREKPFDIEMVIKLLGWVSQPNGKAELAGILWLGRYNSGVTLALDGRGGPTCLLASIEPSSGNFCTQDSINSSEDGRISLISS